MLFQTVRTLPVPVRAAGRAGHINPPKRNPSFMPRSLTNAQRRELQKVTRWVVDAETSSWRARGGCLCGRFLLSEQHTQARGCPVLPLRAPREAIRYDANAQKRNTETIQIDDMPIVFDVCAVRSCALRCFARTHTPLESLSHSDCLSAFLLPGRRRPLIFSPSSLRSRSVVVVGVCRWDKRGQAGRSKGNAYSLEAKPPSHKANTLTR